MLWWAYFDVVALVAVRHLVGIEDKREQNETARDAYSILHLPMVAGIILIALGLKKTIEHVDDPLKAVPAFALVGGVAIYLLAHVAFRWRNVHTLNRRRFALGIGMFALIPLAVEIPALATLAIVTAIACALIAYEAIRYAEHRDRVRHELAAAEGGLGLGVLDLLAVGLAVLDAGALILGQALEERRIGARVLLVRRVLDQLLLGELEPLRLALAGLAQRPLGLLGLVAHRPAAGLDGLLGRRPLLLGHIRLVTMNPLVVTHFDLLPIGYPLHSAQTRPSPTERRLCPSLTPKSTLGVWGAPAAAIAPMVCCCLRRPGPMSPGPPATPGASRSACRSASSWRASSLSCHGRHRPPRSRR